MTATSPVRKYPSWKASCVSSGLFQYPLKIIGPLATNSPASPTGTSFDGSSSLPASPRSLAPAPLPKVPRSPRPPVRGYLEERSELGSCSLLGRRLCGCRRQTSPRIDLLHSVLLGHRRCSTW